MTWLWHYYDNPEACKPSSALRINWPSHSGEVTWPGAGRPFWGREWSNRTVLVEGDSINGELYGALVCNLRAHGFAVMEADMHVRRDRSMRDQASAESRDCATRPSPHPSGPRVTAFYERVCAISSAAADRDWSYYHHSEGVYIPETDTLLVHRGHSKYEPGIAVSLSLGDVVVLNYGLHYGAAEPAFQAPPDAFRDGISSLLQLTSTWPGQLLLKEVSAQHFPDTGAYASTAQKSRADCVCETMDNLTRTTNWVAQQNHILRSLARGHPVRTTLLPFYEATARSAGMALGEHVDRDGRRRCDCTHSCYDAGFWNEVFDSWGPLVFPRLLRRPRGQHARR